MPASLPGSTAAENAANPSAGAFVLCDPLSGPKGSPFDARKIASWSGTNPVYAADAANLSTGALSTGIGFGSPPVMSTGQVRPNFTDDYIPGRTLPDGSTTSVYLLYIGGGRSTAAGVPNPYNVAALGLCGAGNGGSRDSTVVGFAMKSVTAAGAVANGAAVETGWTNRSGLALGTGQSVFGSSTTGLAAPA